jgi:hypothetical protein
MASCHFHVKETQTRTSLLGIRIVIITLVSETGYEGLTPSSPAILKHRNAGSNPALVLSDDSLIGAKTSIVISVSPSLTMAFRSGRNIT